MPDFASAAAVFRSSSEAAEAADAVVAALKLGKPLYRKRDVQWLLWYAALPPAWPRWGVDDSPILSGCAALCLAAAADDRPAFVRGVADLFREPDPPPHGVQASVDAAHHYAAFPSDDGWRFDVSPPYRPKPKDAPDPGLPAPLRELWAEHAPRTVEVSRSTLSEPIEIGVPQPLQRTDEHPGEPDALHAVLLETDWRDVTVAGPWAEVAPFARAAFARLADDPALKDAAVRPSDLDRDGLLAAIADLEPTFGRPFWTQLVAAYPPLGTAKNPKWSPFERPDDTDPAGAVRFPLHERERGDFLTRLDAVHPPGRPGEVVLDLQQVDRSPERRAAAKLADLLAKTGRDDFEPWVGDPWGRWE